MPTGDQNDGKTAKLGIDPPGRNAGLGMAGATGSLIVAMYRAARQRQYPYFTGVKWRVVARSSNA